MNVLVACEFGGIVREAFRKRGHNAWSCDLIETEIFGQHIIGDVRGILDAGWDLMIAHPPCTYLCIAGLHYSKKSQARMNLTKEAYEFFMFLYNSNIPKIAIENPVGIVSTWFRKPDQIIDPFQFHAAERKKNLFMAEGFVEVNSSNKIRGEAYKNYYT